MLKILSYKKLGTRLIGVSGLIGLTLWALNYSLSPIPDPINLEINAPPDTLLFQGTANVINPVDWQILTLRPLTADEQPIYVASGSTVKLLNLPAGSSITFSYPLDFDNNDFSVVNASQSPDSETEVGDYAATVPSTRQLPPEGGNDTLNRYETLSITSPVGFKILRFRAVGSRPMLFVLQVGDSFPEAVTLNYPPATNPPYLTAWQEFGRIDSNTSSSFQLTEVWQGQQIWILNASPFGGEIAVDFF